MIGSEVVWGTTKLLTPVYTLLLTLATAELPTAVAKLVSEKVAVNDHRGANIEYLKVSRTILVVTWV